MCGNLIYLALQTVRKKIGSTTMNPFVLILVALNIFGLEIFAKAPGSAGGALKKASAGKTASSPNIARKSGKVPAGKYKGSAMLTDMEVNFTPTTFTISFKGIANDTIINVPYTLHGSTVKPDANHAGLKKFMASFGIPQINVSNLKLTYNDQLDTIEAAVLAFKFLAKKV